MRRAQISHLVLVLLFICFLFPGAQAMSMNKKRAETAELPSIVTQACSLVNDDRMEAIAVLEDYLADRPDPELAPWVQLYAGELRRLAGDEETARRHFTVVRDDHSDHVVNAAAILGIALIDGGMNPGGNTLATLGLYQEDEVGRGVVPDTMNADRFRVLALHAQREQENADGIRSLAGQASAYARRAGDDLVQERVDRAVGGLMLYHKVDGQNDDEAGSISLQPVFDELESAQQALLADDFEQARRIAEAFLASWPESPRAREAEYIIQKANRRDPVKPRTVGVLLPLGGVYAPVANRLKNTMEMANDEMGHYLQLVFRDTDGAPEKAVAALEELVLDEGAVAVLGPLLKETVSEVAEAAQALHVPLVTLSQKSGITLGQDYVFRGFMTVEHQVDSLLDHVMGRMGLKGFAVIAPDNAFGHLAAEVFKAAVERREGNVPVVQFYDPTLGDFREAARGLGNKDYEARAAEFHRLKREAEEKHMDPDKVVLPPNVTYDGIFIPDGYHRVALVASALAYEEFPVGTFKPRRSDIPLVMMGLNGWHDDRLALEGGKYVEDGILVDAFDMRITDPQVQSFVALYTEKFNMEPAVLDAMAWDVIAMVVAAARSGAVDRPSLRDALVEVKLEAPLACGGTFDENREVRRSLHVFVVTGAGIELWQPTLEEASP